jgi:putative ABC transport system substrate-binding protein
MRVAAFGLVIALTVGFLTAPVGAQAPGSGKVYRIGVIAIEPPPSSPGSQRSWDAFLQGLRERGWVEGQNIVFERRYSEGKAERYPDLAAELVRLKVDVIVAAAAGAALAAKNATTSIPVVAVAITDPVGSGLVASLARPGGNITGLSLMAQDLVGKQLELIKEAVPKVSRVAVLWNPSHPIHRQLLSDGEVAARSLGVRLQLQEARGPGDFDAAFAAIAREGAGALLVLVDPMLFRHRALLLDLAARKRLPTMWGIGELAEAGALMSYGVNRADHMRGAATYVDKILRGARPADLPVEQPTKFELVINLKTAKALGLTLPQSLLLRADRVIQ